MEGFKEIIFKISGPVAVITLNRPHRLNALGKTLIDEAAALTDIIPTMKDVKIIIITGAGKNFCSGLDVSEMADIDQDEGLRLIRAGAKVYESIYRLRQITIAAVEGYCLGGGFELALSCDILVSSRNAFFGEPEVNFSVLPGIVRVWRHAGLNRARYMALTGNIFAAREVAEWGLISKMTPSGKSLAEAKKIAQMLLEKPETALMTVKRLFSEVMGMTYHEASEAERNAFLELYKTADRQERMRAFKRRKSTR